MKDDVPILLREEVAKRAATSLRTLAKPDSQGLQPRSKRGIALAVTIAMGAIGVIIVCIVQGAPKTFGRAE